MTLLCEGHRQFLKTLQNRKDGVKLKKRETKKGEKSFKKNKKLNKSEIEQLELNSFHKLQHRDSRADTISNVLQV